MQAAPVRYVSVSELYSTDEVELLLDEIRELEPTSCRGEDVQDFEIAGSGCGGAGGSGAGGRSPAGTEGTERSWDSHAQYRRGAAPRARPLAPLYWRPRHLASAAGAAALAVAAAGACACACAWAAAGGARLPPALRPLALGALSSLLLHAALLAVRLAGLHRLLPLDWALLALCCNVWAAVSQSAGASVALALAGEGAGAGAGAPPRRDLRLAAAGLSYVGAVAGAAGACAAAWRRCGRAGGAGGGAGAGAGAARGAYRAVPSAPPAPPAARDPL